jgi:hypothetical protein
VNAITSTTGRKDAAPKLNYKVYNIYNEARRSVDRKPEANWKVLKRVVGAKGFEPSTFLVPKIGRTKNQQARKTSAGSALTDGNCHRCIPLTSQLRYAAAHLAM